MIFGPFLPIFDIIFKLSWGYVKTAAGWGGLSFLLNIDLKCNFHINWDAFDPFYQPKLV